MENLTDTILQIYIPGNAAAKHPCPHCGGRGAAYIKTRTPAGERWRKFCTACRTQMEKAP